MLKRILLLSILIGGLSFQAQAQKVSFSGIVSDTLGIPLQFANVLAMDTVENTMAAFAVTNDRGAFRIRLKQDKIYKLTVSFVGFQPFEKVFKAKKSNETPYVIKLKADATQLDEVEVVAEMPVLIQGDTITYKVEVFTQGNERKLKDVLSDLPGFEVDRDGNVKVQGKRVDKVLVEGKVFFDGGTQLATKNIPANVVDKVQVLQNFNDVGVLSRVNNSEELALNIQLKEDKKSFVFGDVTAAAGPEDRYLGHVNSFYYNPKTNLNLIANANNVGRDAFSGQSFRFGSRLGGFSSRAGSSFSVSSGGQGIPRVSRNSAQSLKNKLAALNYNYTPNGKWLIAGFAIGSGIDNVSGSKSQRTYVLQPDDNREVLTSSQNMKSTAGQFKLTLKHTPNVDLQVDYNAFGNLGATENLNRRNSTFVGQSNDINGTNTQHPVSIEQQLRAFYAPNVKDIYTFEAAYQYQKQDPAYRILNTGQPFASIIPLTGKTPYDLTQLQEVATQRQETSINYYRILNKTNHINLKAGNHYVAQRLTSGMFERLTDGRINNFKEKQLNNLVNYTFQNYYLSLLYKTKLEKLVFTPSLNLHYYDMSNRQGGAEGGFKKTLLLPAVSAQYKFRSSHSINLNYGVTAGFTDVTNVAKALVIRGYNSLFSGNENLENSLYRNLSLNYSNFNMYNFFNIYGGVNYGRSLQDIGSAMRFNNLERVNTPININTANEVLSGNAGVGKRFKKTQLNLSANWSRNTSNNRISDIDNKNVSFTQSYNLSLSTTLFDRTWLDLGYNLSFNSYKGNNVSNRTENHRPYAQLSLRFLKDFTFKSDYQYNAYRTDTGQQNTFDMLNAELRFRKEGSPWEFSVEGMNLLNTTALRNDAFTQSLISINASFIQKRYWLFSIMYDL